MKSKVTLVCSSDTAVSKFQFFFALRWFAFQINKPFSIWHYGEFKNLKKSKRIRVVHCASKTNRQIFLIQNFQDIYIYPFDRHDPSTDDNHSLPYFSGTCMLTVIPDCPVGCWNHLYQRAIWHCIFGWVQNARGVQHHCRSSFTQCFLRPLSYTVFLFCFLYSFSVSRKPRDTCGTRKWRLRHIRPPAKFRSVARNVMSCLRASKFYEDFRLDVRLPSAKYWKIINLVLNFRNQWNMAKFKWKYSVSKV